MIQKEWLTTWVQWTTTNSKNLQIITKQTDTEHIGDCQNDVRTCLSLISGEEGGRRKITSLASRHLCITLSNALTPWAMHGYMVRTYIIPLCYQVPWLGNCKQTVNINWQNVGEYKFLTHTWFGEDGVAFVYYCILKIYLHWKTYAHIFICKQHLVNHLHSSLFSSYAFVMDWWTLCNTQMTTKM